MLAVEVGSGFGSGIVMVDTSDNSGTLNDIKLDADDLPVYINFKGSVTDPTTNQVFPIGDTATTSVQCRVDVFGTEVTLTVYNGRPNTIRANLIIEYLTTA